MCKKAGLVPIVHYLYGSLALRKYTYITGDNWLCWIKFKIQGRT
jgi:hypothetical protein